MGKLDFCFLGSGFFSVVFESAQDRDKIDEKGPWFMGTAGLFMRPWISNFDPEKEDPSAIPVWVKLPILPMEY